MALFECGRSLGVSRVRCIHLLSSSPSLHATKTSSFRNVQKVTNTTNDEYNTCTPHPRFAPRTQITFHQDAQVRQHFGFWNPSEAQGPLTFASTSTNSSENHFQHSVSSTRQHATRARLLQTLPRLECHDLLARRTRCLNFGLLNARSLNNKLDNVLQIARDFSTEIFLITESWHDPDSNCIGQLRQLGFNVTHRPRPRSHAELPSINTNHGGLLAFSKSSIKLSVVSMSTTPTTFEHLCYRV